LGEEMENKNTPNKCTHVTFTKRNQTCQTVQIGKVDLPQKNEVKYLGMHLERRLTWAKHIKSKKEITQPKSETNELAARKKINTISRKQTPPVQSSLKPIWTYGSQPQIPTSKSSSASNPRLSDPF
jgi:hypothetical protein